MKLHLFALLLFLNITAQQATAQDCPHFDRLMKAADSYWKSEVFVADSCRRR